MVKIDKSLFIGKGAHRECYRHPEHGTLCVKVVVSGHAKESNREKKYYRHLEKRGISWDMISRYHGDVETDMGVGAVFDLVLDEDAAISKTLGHYLSSEDETEKYYDSLSNALLRLKKYLFDNRIITMNLDPSNILCRKSASGISDLCIIDNVYNTEFIPVSTYITFFARIKLNRKWRRFEKRLLSVYKSNHLLRQMIQDLQYTAK